jgi:hypothetical protein
MPASGTFDYVTASPDVLYSQALKRSLGADVHMAHEIDTIMEELRAKVWAEWTDVPTESVSCDTSDSLGLTESVSGRTSIDSSSSQDSLKQERNPRTAALDDRGAGLLHNSLEQMMNDAAHEKLASKDCLSGLQPADLKFDAGLIALLAERLHAYKRQDSCPESLERASNPGLPVETPQPDDKPARFKTRICRNWLHGNCEFGAKCIFAHGDAELQLSEVGPATQKPLMYDSAFRYKTRICHNWLNGHCDFGAGCIFAHGEAELRACENEVVDNSQNDPRPTAVGDPAKYKTAICRNWLTGRCDFGSRCFFAHGQAELRTLKEGKLPGNSCQSNPQRNTVGDPAKYKTAICRNWLNGRCEFGTNCFFAHGHAERVINEEKLPRDSMESCQHSAVRDAKYKTTMCHNWLNGQCDFGRSCSFAHGQGELRPTPVGECSNLPSQPKTLQALPEGAAAMQQMAQQASEISSLYKRLGSHQAIKDPKTDRPQVIVDLKFFQSLLQTVNSILVDATVDPEQCQTVNSILFDVTVDPEQCQRQQQPLFSEASLERLLNLNTN